jgi:Fic family protein
MFEPRYLITHGILKNVGKIEACREVIDNAALVPQWEKKFRDEAMVRAVHFGTRIEGNDLSYQQAEKVLLVDGDKAETVALKAGVSARDRDVQEVINYREVLEWIDRWGIKVKPPVMYSPEILKTIHKMTVRRLLNDQESGEFRKVQVAIKNSRTGELVFMPPPSVEVPYQIHDFFAWINSDEGRLHHAILRAGITHYELVRIHPFVDGNGRSARAMATLVMYAEGYDLKRFFSIEEYFDNDPLGYYQALASVGEGENMDLTMWLEYFTLGLAAELERIKDQVVKLSRDTQFKGKLGKQVALSERQIKIIEALNNRGKLTTGDANNLLPSISPDTILRDFKDLIDKGVVEKKGRTKGAFYVLK